ETIVTAMGCQVAVTTATTAARRAVEALFRNMRAPADAGIPEHIELERLSTGWVVSSASEDAAVHCSLSHALWGVRERITRLVMTPRPDLLWPHAAGVARDGPAILIGGPGGSGKSVLASRLAADGFAYLADDALPFHSHEGIVYPFPVTPAVR